MRYSLVCLILILSLPLCAADLFVDASRADDSGDGLSTGTAKKTIAAAISISANGDVIHVAAGTYAEAFVIDKSVTLLGAQAGIDARTRNVPAVQESVIQATGSATSVIFDADSITLDGFTINGDTLTVGADDLGIEMYPSFSGSQIVNNIVSNNTIGLYPAASGALQTIIKFNAFIDNNLPGGASGNAMYTDFGLKNALIASNKFSNNSNAAVLVTAVPPGVINDRITIQDNDITNCGVAVLLALASSSTVDNNRMSGCVNGVQIRGGCDGITISNNTIVDSTQRPIVCKTRDDVGINNRDMTVRGNIIRQNGAVFGPTTSQPGDSRALIDLRDIMGQSIIDKNFATLTGTLSAAAPRVPGIEIQGAAMGSVSMNFNELDGGHADPSGSATPSAGVRLGADIPSTSTIDIKNSIVHGFAFGVESLMINPRNNIHANYNSFSDLSSGVAIQNSDTGSLDALYNWYGDATGPLTPNNPTGKGLSVSQAVLFNPWLGTGVDQLPLDQSNQSNFLASVGFQTPGTPLGNLPPVVLSAATAAPNPANAGDVVQFSAAGADSLNRTITTTWDFGDGATASGASVAHVYPVPGTFTAVATLRTPDGGSVSTSVVITVTETGGGAATPPDPFTVKRKSLRASGSAKDSIALQGAFNLPAGTTRLDGTFAVSIGTLSGTFTVNGKGKGTGANGKLTIRAKLKRGVIQGTAVTFSVSLVGNVNAALAAASLPAGNSGNAVLNADFTYLGKPYASALTFKVKGARGKSAGK